MSKYTTEVRFICETEAGLTESVGYSKVNEVLDKSWNKIFDVGDWDIYDEEYRPILCKKILKHFYTREISAETVGLWKLWLNQRMAEIMPYYNQLYKSTLLEFNPLYDTDYKTEGNRKTDEGEESGRETKSDYTRTDDLTSQRTDNLNSTRTDNLQQVRNDDLHETTSNTRYDLYSDTPQGALTGVESETYLTNARKVTDNGSRDNTGTQTTNNTGTQDLKNTGTQTVENSGTVSNKGGDTENSKRVLNNTQDYAEHVIGKRGTQSYAKMIMELRDSFINIDMMIIDELNDLFFNLW